MTTPVVCTGGHHPGYTIMDGKTLVDLPCGCQDVHYADGTVCYEHAHVECNGAPEETQ